MRHCWDFLAPPSDSTPEALCRLAPSLHSWLSRETEINIGLKAAAVNQFVKQHHNISAVTASSSTIARAQRRSKLVLTQRQTPQGLQQFANYSVGYKSFLMHASNYIKQLSLKVAPLYKSYVVFLEPGTILNSELQNLEREKSVNLQVINCLKSN